MKIKRKRLTVAVSEPMEAELRRIRATVYAGSAQSAMLRDLMSRGLNAWQEEGERETAEQRSARPGERRL